MKKMLGTKPAIIGKVLSCTNVSDSVCEIVLDASKSRSARYLISAACNKAVIMDLGILIQADNHEELPERLLGAVRIHRLQPTRDISFASPTTKGKRVKAKGAQRSRDVGGGENDGAGEGGKEEREVRRKGGDRDDVSEAGDEDDEGNDGDAERDDDRPVVDVVVA